MTSLRSTLNALILSKGTCTYGEIVTEALEYGAKVSAAERRLRELAAEGKIKALEKKSKKGTNYIYAYTVESPPEKEKEILGWVELNGEKKIIYK